MQVEIIHQNSQAAHRVLTPHAGAPQYIQVPDTGAYSIRLRNTTPRRQLVVVSVDGLNVLDGEEASVDGGGYVLRPWETLDIPGWRRSDGTVAAFTVKPQEASYAAQTGRGTTNVGVIGVAVFEEKVATVQPRTPWVQDTLPGYWPWGQPIWVVPLDNSSRPSWGTYNVTCNEVGGGPSFGGITRGVTRGMGGDTRGVEEVNLSMAGVTFGNTVGAASEAAPTQVGTAYGAEVTFHTTTTEFVRASAQPAEVIRLRYGTRAQLVSWGVLPATLPPPSAPNPFPKSQPSCAPPPGWRG